MRAKNELKQLSEAYQNVLNEDSGSYSDIIKRQAAERTEKARKSAMQHQGSRNQGKLNLPWNSGRYESDEEVVNGNEIDLNADPSAQKVQKKAIPLQFRVTDRPETIETLEGSVEAPTGAYIMTGTKGENWPIPGDKFDATYDIIDAWGDGGKASKKAIPVPAKQMQEDFFVTVSWSPDKLNGKPGDWLVQYGPGDYGVVEASIFDETYDLLGEDEENTLSRGKFQSGYTDDEYDEPLHSPYHPDNIERLATGRSFGQHHDHLRKDEKDHKISGEDWIRDRKGNPIKRKDFNS